MSTIVLKGTQLFFDITKKKKTNWQIKMTVNID